MAELESSKEMEKDVTTSLAKWKAGRVAVENYFFHISE